MVTTEIKVERYQWTRYGPLAMRGSGYCEDQGQYHLLVKRWKWRGLTIWKKTLDREEIPAFVWIAMATVGYTNWRSKFKEYM
jgi:hypothetical protein